MHRTTIFALIALALTVSAAIALATEQAPRLTATTAAATPTVAVTMTPVATATATPGAPPAMPPPTVISSEGGIAPVLPQMIEPLTGGGLLNARLVAGQSFAAVFESETVRTVPGGTSATTRVVTKIWRDLLGRTRREQIFYPTGTTPSPTDAAQTVTIHDPVARRGYVLNTAAKTAERFKLPTTLPTVPPISDQIAGVMRVYRTESPAGGTTTHTLAAPVIVPLGVQTIAGVLATGKRVTTPIPAGAFGNQAAVSAVYETWFAIDLQMLVKCTLSNPASGSHTLLLKTITRAEQPRLLFEAPANYAVSEMGAVRNDLPPPR